MSTKEQQNKKFYFQEIDKIIDFPNHINKGKYATYRVQIKNKSNPSEPGESVLLGEFLDTIQVDRNYPHTVGYYKDSKGEGECFCPEYLELRKIYYVEEFWLFLNACDL